MTKAADIIAALTAGRPALVFERRSGMTYGWGLWMRALPERLGAIRSDGSEAMVGLLAQRPPAPPEPRSDAMGRWQAFRALFYPHWGPPPREERGLRWFAGGVSLFMHLLFVLLLVLVAMVRVPPPAPTASNGSRVQVEFIGQGTPEQDTPVQTPPEQAQDASPAAAAATAQATPQAQVPAPAAEPPITSAVEQPSPLPQQEQPAPSPPVAEQPLQVTETEVPTSRFVLPPATPPAPEFIAPRIDPQELSVPTREITVVQVPPAQRAPPQVDVPVQSPAEPQVEIREREIALPVPEVPAVRVPTREIAAPDRQVPAPMVRQREIPAPSPADAASVEPAPTATAPGTAAAAESADRTQGIQSAATADDAAASGRTGAPASPLRGDDWGDALRNAPGQAAPGLADDLFNADGSVRLPSDAGARTAPTAGPSGSRQAQQADADRASKWLERPEYPYEPTMFDKYWVPNESLLAEWVRRAIREVEVPIPGTSKRVRCVVSILQAGGACGLFDPNLNEQPATARPPPEIPVKRTPIPVDS